MAHGTALGSPFSSPQTDTIASHCQTTDTCIVYRAVCPFFCWYSVRLPTDGWPGWVDLGGCMVDGDQRVSCVCQLLLNEYAMLCHAVLWPPPLSPENTAMLDYAFSCSVQSRLYADCRESFNVVISWVVWINSRIVYETSNGCRMCSAH